MVNNGDGTFTLDDARAPNTLIHNPYPEYWRHVGNDLVDLDNDGDLDLALGQIRDFAPHTINVGRQLEIPRAAVLARYWLSSCPEHVGVVSFSTDPAGTDDTCTTFVLLDGLTPEGRRPRTPVRLRLPEVTAAASIYSRQRRESP